MSSEMVPRRTKVGWIIELVPDLAEALGVVKGSIAIMSPNEGKIDFEIIPPPSPELIAASERIHHKYKEVFEELKRLGD